MYHSPFVRESKTGFQGLNFVFFFLSVEPGFRISIVSGISDSSRCITDLKAQDLGFQIRRAKMLLILEFVFPYKGRVLYS